VVKAIMEGRLLIVPEGGNCFRHQGKSFDVVTRLAYMLGQAPEEKRSSRG
jgi:hypothetical protein